MARTLVQLNRQMEALQREADRIRASEVAGVIKRIQTAIEFYSLTASDLFGKKSKVSARRLRKLGRPAGAKTKAAALPRYRDKDSGNTWTGHGRRPSWFVKAIESGMKAEDMAV